MNVKQPPDYSVKVLKVLTNKKRHGGGGDEDIIDTESFDQDIQVVISNWDRMEEGREREVETGKEAMRRGERVRRVRKEFR